MQKGILAGTLRSTPPMRLGVLATHPIQYHAPLYRELARRLDLHVYFAHRQTPAGQAAAGFGVEFEWDVPLLDGYAYTFLENRAARPSTATSDGCDTPEIAGIIARESFDAFLVNGWYNRSYRQAIRACWRTRTPVMVRGDSQLLTPRSPAKRLAKEAIYRWFIPRFDRYLVVGQRARAYYLHYGADPERMYFVPHFVDNDWFAERARKADRTALRVALGARPDSILLLFAGKLIPKKRPHDLVYAAAELRRLGLDVHAVFAGSGPLDDDLRALAGQLEVTAHFLGFKNQTELPACYTLADLLVLPSDAGETWGLVVNEAMACGTPAVVSDQVGCAPDLIDSGVTGEMFATANPPALADAVQRLLPALGTTALRDGLADKMRLYSLETAVEGVLEAMPQPRVAAPARKTPEAVA